MSHSVELRLMKWCVEVQEDAEYISRSYFETYEAAKAEYDKRANFERYLVIEVIRNEAL